MLDSVKQDIFSLIYVNTIRYYEQLHIINKKENDASTSI